MPLPAIPDALLGALGTAAFTVPATLLAEWWRRKPRHVTSAEARKADAEAGAATAESAMNIAAAYEKLVGDLQADIDRQNKHVEELRKEGHRLRNRVQGLSNLLKSTFAYAETLETLVLGLGGTLPERPQIIEAEAEEVSA